MTTNKSRRQRQRNALLVVFTLSFVSLLAIAPSPSQSRVSFGGSVPEALSLQTPSPSPTASPIASPAASPAASPVVTVPAVAKVTVTIDSSDNSKALDLVQGETRTVHVKAFDSNNAEITNATSKITASKEGVVNVDPPVGNAHKITALGVKNKDSTTLKIEVNNQEYPDKQISVNVLEAVASIEAEGGNTISIAEGDSFTLKFKVKGTQSESLDGGTQPFETPEIRTDALKPLIRYEKDTVQGGFIITANSIMPPTVAPVTGRITFRATNGFNKQPTPPLTINVTVREKFGYITFEPPPKGFLLPGGSFTTLAVVRGKNGSPKSNYGVEFRADRESDLKWISLSPEGNKLNVYWNDPADQEITKPDGTKEKRPAQVIIRAIARSGVAGEEITGFILVRMGEVTKFERVKVKLNLMDQVTAGDLYGKVMSEEYYVLTVRLFNNLRDDVTKEFTGDSILAYSASMEVAVGLEKKFNPDSDSEFPNVIKKDAARDIANKRRKATVELANTQADREIKAAKRAQTELDAAIEAERSTLIEARAARKTASDLRDGLPRLRARLTSLELKSNKTGVVNDLQEAKKAKQEFDTAFAAAVEATYAANVKIRRAHEAAEETNRVRASIMRAAANRVTVSQNIMGNSDPDTVIDDGRWHPVNPSDFNRIAGPGAPAEDPLPFLPDLDPDIFSDHIKPAENEQVASNETPQEDPPCRNTITYRPFTFEMMVNTVDRRDGRSTRSKLFKILDAVGIGTSFVTSIAVPGNSSDLPLGLEKYGNLLIPGIDKLYPNYKEQNRQNIVAQTMKELEEIPFGSDITRVIFIPKKTIRGLIRGHDTRISEVCPFYFKVEVAIINKRSTVSAGQR